MDKNIDINNLFNGLGLDDDMRLPFEEPTPNEKLNENQMLLPSGKIITFNDEQFEGIKRIKQWLKTGNTFFTLAGYAGTGKTTIIKKVLEAYRYGVVVSAPTHKAKKVIMSTTGKEGQTLHGLLGLRPDVDLDNFNPNDPKFNPIAVPKIADYNFVIIDEASMINQELYDLIIEKTKDTRTKVLFMGDPAQIPPVGEKASVVFMQDQTKEFHQLTKIERQNDTNPLAFIYDALRNNLDTLDGGFLRKSNVNELGEGVIFTVNKMSFRKAILEKYLSEEFKKDTDFCKVIAWKNDTVMLSNSIIREQLLGKNTDIIEVGDLLMGYRSISDEKQRYNIIENSADYRVVEKSGLEENAYGIKGFRVKLKEDLPQKHFRFQDVFIIDANNHNNLHLYGQMHDFFRDMGRSNKRMWNKYYSFRRNNMLMKTIDEYINGQPREKPDIIVKDLDYGYAITGHKSQGSTYSHVFVMENDINLNWVMKERNQIKYVALTRPVHTATVLTTKIDV
jgi:exodeoxyribonuclease-5